MGNRLRDNPATLLNGVHSEEGKALLLNAALGLTRMDKTMRKACRLVILEGKAPVVAAKRVDRKRQNVSRALATLRPALVKVMEEYDGRRAVYAAMVPTGSMP